MGAAVCAGDIFSLDPGAALHIVFRNGTQIWTIGGTLSIAEYLYAKDEDDRAVFALDDAMFALAGGRIASGVDTLSVHAGWMRLSVRAARLIGKAGMGIDDMVTLLPTPFDGPGSVLVHNKASVETLEAPYQTVRLSGTEGYLTQPMTLPLGVIAEIYSDSALAPWLTPVARASAPDEGITGEGFAPFDVLNDQLFERRFTVQGVFPRDHSLPGSGDRGHQNTLLEDAFDGQRFRLKKNEPNL